MGKVGIIVDGGASINIDLDPRADVVSWVLVDACLRATRKIMSAGADHVKICTSGGVLSPYDKVDSVQFTVPEIKAISQTVKDLVGRIPPALESQSS